MNRLETTITQKGQVTIPAEIRTLLGLRPRDKVRFEVEGNEVKLKPATSRLLEGYGAVTPRKRPEDWNRIRVEVEQLIAEDVVGED